LNSHRQAVQQVKFVRPRPVEVGCPLREELAVARVRFWLVVAMMLGLVCFTTGSSAQDKGKTEDKAAEKTATADGKVELRWKFEKNQPLYQEMTSKTSQFMKVMGMEVNQTQEQTFYFSWTLKDVDKDNNMTLVQRIEGVKLKIDIAGNPITFDSNNPSSANTSLAEFFKQLVGAEFRLTVDKDMKVTKVEGREEFLKKLGQANQSMEPLLKQVLNDEALKQMADPSFGILPGKPVGKGDTWTRDTKLALGPIGTYKNTYKYTVESIENGIVKIKVESTLTYEPPAQPGQGLPFQIKSAKLSSKDAGGTIVFDANKGRMDSQEMKVKLEGELEIEISSQTNKVELKQEQSTSIKTSDQPQMKKN
jgi:hypothetical protein